MKFFGQIFSILLATMLLFSQCNNQTPSSQPAVSASSLSSSAPPSSKSELDPNVAYLPASKDIPLTTLPFDASDRFGKDVEVFIAPGKIHQPLIDELESLSGEDFLETTAGGQFIALEELSIILVSDSPMGLSTVLVRNATGQYDILLTSPSGIRSISMLNRTTMILEVAYRVHYSAIGCLNYEYDLTSGESKLSLLEKTVYVMSEYQMLYNGKHYRVKVDMHTLDEKEDEYSLFAVESGQEDRLMIEDFAVFAFEQGYLLYQKVGEPVLYRYDLETGLSTVHDNHLLPDPLLTEITEEYYLYSDQDSEIIVSRLDGKAFPILEDRVEHISADHYFTVSAAEVLYYAPFDGKKKAVVANFSGEWRIVGAHNDILFLSSYVEGDAVSRYVHWAINLDGTGLIRIDNLD